MSAVDEFLDLVAQRVAYVNTQAAAGMDEHAMLELQIRQVCLHISLMGTIRVEDATTIGASINTGPWSQEQKTTLHRCLSDATLAPRRLRQPP